jgi:antitoxin HicB
LWSALLDSDFAIITPGEPMANQVTIPLTLEPQPEGGFAVRSPALPALITEGDTEAEALENAWDALLALLDAYDQLGWPLPLGLPPAPERAYVHFEQLSAA